ncbi:PHD finger-like domain-containing protein 5A isoform X1 [Canis lupus familiaris]|uniref:PHD finger-like domain-containing protein 5A isoform X1 n=1 Tax=Canis lupus familiaris TaxID=9615 RepID=UPI000BAA110A|nr:PHD finger-like domain-containing protein 5A isoform X1 [Canis lupus familiaris]XP_025314382.1 PHD finger-like domain-containing protein 5A isoform X1 [Canis lupus dingo]XP_038406354.1 PHD finger-like domain-containing protein 5A isoform X1 [Canis lupus familiaris]XP_038535662.1 PHD finger-like domain-containing protein 5A isoform X1 [Canis lupus familiaris]|eukprot:XP_022280080.1 PHD finger-like domain-containing protein 5A isoform X1 [Canis lupus familiaris]
MAKHHPDLIFCRKQAGVGEAASCPGCLSGDCIRSWGVRGSHLILRVLSLKRQVSRLTPSEDCVKNGRCVICGGPGVSDAYYCKECTIQEKDRDGCPKIVNLGSSKTDLFYERKKYGFKKR